MTAKKLKNQCYQLKSNYITLYSSCVPTSIWSTCLSSAEKTREKIPSCLTTIQNSDGSTSTTNTICEKTTQYPNAEISPITNECCLNWVKQWSTLGSCN